MKEGHNERLIFQEFNFRDARTDAGDIPDISYCSFYSTTRKCRPAWTGAGMAVPIL